MACNFEDLALKNLVTYPRGWKRAENSFFPHPVPSSHLANRSEIVTVSLISALPAALTLLVDVCHLTGSVSALVICYIL